MDFDITKVNYSGLDLGEQAFMTAFNSLVGELEDLENNLNTKTAIWEGTSKTAYERERMVWQTEAKGLADIAQILAKNIKLTNMNMQDVERINTAMFDGK